MAHWVNLKTGILAISVVNSVYSNLSLDGSTLDMQVNVCYVGKHKAYKLYV